jgi:hypothetical protein
LRGTRWIPRNIAEDVTNYVGDIVQNIVEKYNDEVTPGGAKVTLDKCGSSAEGTKVILPDEFDFLFKFPQDNISSTEIIDFKDGYRFYSRNVGSTHENNLETLLPFLKGSNIPCCAADTRNICTMYAGYT